MHLLKLFCRPNLSFFFLLRAFLDFFFLTKQIFFPFKKKKTPMENIRATYFLLKIPIRVIVIRGIRSLKNLFAISF